MNILKGESLIGLKMGENWYPADEYSNEETGFKTAIWLDYPTFNNSIRTNEDSADQIIPRFLTALLQQHKRKTVGGVKITDVESLEKAIVASGGELEFTWKEGQTLNPNLQRPIRLWMINSLRLPEDFPVGLEDLMYKTDWEKTMDKNPFRGGYYMNANSELEFITWTAKDEVTLNSVRSWNRGATMSTTGIIGFGPKALYDIFEAMTRGGTDNDFMKVAFSKGETYRQEIIRDKTFTLIPPR